MPLMSSSENPQAKNSFLLLALSFIPKCKFLHNHCQFFSLSGFLPLLCLQKLLLALDNLAGFPNYFSDLHNVWPALTQPMWDNSGFMLISYFPPFWKDNFPHFRALLWKLDSRAYCDLCAIHLFPFVVYLAKLFLSIFQSLNSNSWWMSLFLAHSSFPPKITVSKFGGCFLFSLQINKAQFLFPTKNQANIEIFFVNFKIAYFKK